MTDPKERELYATVMARRHVLREAAVKWKADRRLYHVFNNALLSLNQAKDALFLYRDERGDPDAGKWD